MKPISCLGLIAIVTISSSCFARKKPKKEKSDDNKIETLLQETDTCVSSGNYRPNAVILAGVGQIMNGAMSIAQDPHSRPNLGHSIAHMIHGIISIIIERIAHKKIDLTDRQAIEECFNELSLHLSDEITEIIIKKNIL